MLSISDILSLKRGYTNTITNTYLEELSIDDIVSVVRNRILSGGKIEFRVKTIFDGEFSTIDTSIIRDAVTRWQSVIKKSTLPGNFVDLTMTFNMSILGEGTLAAAAVSDTQNGFATSGNVWINSINWQTQKDKVKYEGKTEAYFTILHEIGHVLGIGTLWNSMIVDGLYIGFNGLREYRNLLSDESLVGVPIEDDGGAGTQGGHIEEGTEPYSSVNNRVISDVLHSGLDSELMTGWSERTDGNEPLSKVTVGMLDDLGFEVDYESADLYVFNNSGYLNKTETLKVRVNGGLTYDLNVQYDESVAHLDAPPMNDGTIYVSCLNGEVVLSSLQLVFHDEVTINYHITAVSDIIQGTLVGSQEYIIYLGGYTNIKGGIKTIKLILQT